MAWASAHPEWSRGRSLRVDAIALTGPDPATAGARARRGRPAVTVARTWAVALTGLEGALVEVEADLSKQTPEFHLIGLPDKALGEAVQRVHNACANSELPLPRRRLTVNLSPASLPKQGSGFDVAIAIASLATEGAMDVASVERTVHIGELGLDGRLRPVPGVLPAVHAAARAGFRRVVVPHANRAEARTGRGRHGARCGVPRGRGAVARRGGRIARDVDPVAGPRVDTTEPEPPDLVDVVGQREAVEALIAAAAGGHHLLMTGPPGAGKTMLASRLPGHPARARRRRGARGRLDPLALRRSRRRALPARALRGAAPQRQRRGARRRRVAAGAPGRDRAGEPRGALPRRGGGVRHERARRAAAAPGVRVDHDPPCGRHGRVPRALPARDGHQPLPLRQLRRARCGVRVPAAFDPALPRTALRPAARSHRHRAGTHPRGGRASRRAGARRGDDGCRARARRRGAGRGRAIACARRRGGSTPTSRGRGCGRDR